MAGDSKAQLIDGLNEDLQGEFQAIIMYRLYASMVQGPYRQELRAFFANEIPEELRTPRSSPTRSPRWAEPRPRQPAPVKVVAEAKAMLQAALEAEMEAIDRYVSRRKQAEDAGEYGLAAEFDTIIADETNHRDELQQMLARWP